ncbi:carboxymuconolactone decarboxylase family protein [Caldovatus aquaticus]|uniref:Carboxymuconolactone decarboxylase family protein n=1 Tax=Caldovatus aquaticus TaxID=2865671 RepID=A0ABS7F004_9PROT|nr:carboxymuconolactone decarboxylase family protein [Caldovatus aquaticus]MBW8268938.1 carboxymuconolactone decarboxylase family protein [Caldovatus aquaticus]
MSSAGAAPPTAQGRFPPIPPERMSPEQRAVAEAIASGPRGSLRGPFNALLRSPVLADRFQRLGEYLRFRSAIPPALNELAILIAAREWTAQYEWYAHHRLAMQAGLSPAIAEAIAQGRRPEGMSEDEALVYDFCTELHRTRTVSDATFERARARFGEQGVVDLIGVSGYYVAVAMVLNVAQVPLPEGVAPPLAPLPGR